MSSIKSVIISSAGLGTRLGLGQTKSLIDINGRSLISHQLELFKDIEDVRIVVGYQAKDIIDEVLSIRKDVIFIYNHHYFETKTGASFYLGARDANEYVIAWDGDLLVHPDDVKKILAEQEEFICYSEKSSEETVFVKLDKRGDVVGFSELEGQFEWTGPACIKKKKLKYNPTSHVFQTLEPHLPIKGIKVRAYDIDTYDDYVRVSSIIKEW